MSTTISSRIRKRLIFFVRKGKFSDYIVMALSIGVFLALWYIASDLLNTIYFPNPSKVFDALVNSFSYSNPQVGVLLMGQNIAASMTRFLEGFALAFILALPIGLLMGYLRYAYDVGSPIVEIFRPIPPIAWVPFFIILLGPLVGPIWVIFLGAFFPILSNVIFGVRSVDNTLLDAAKTLGAKRITIFSKVVLPYTVPFIMAGVTIGVGIAWMCIVAAEMLGAEGGGVGSYIRVNSDLNNFPAMFAGMVVIAALGLMTLGVARLLEKQVSPWRGK
jgi:NitT/TauT family transport system permease protein